MVSAAYSKREINNNSTMSLPKLKGSCLMKSLHRFIIRTYWDTGLDSVFSRSGSSKVFFRRRVVFYSGRGLGTGVYSITAALFRKTDYSGMWSHVHLITIRH